MSAFGITILPKALKRYYENAKVPEESIEAVHITGEPDGPNRKIDLIEIQIQILHSFSFPNNFLSSLPLSLP